MAPVLLERRGQVQVVTINRPEARNAVDLAVAQGIAAALDELDASAEPRAAVLTGAGALIWLPRRLPYHLAMELALTGEPLPAERAAALGLVNRLLAPGRALEAALELAALVVRGGPLACEASRRILAGALDASEAEAWRQQDELVAEVATSHDAREGARAFAEKRPPVWQGR